MENTITFNDQQIKITGTIIAKGVNPPNWGKEEYTHNQFKIKIKTPSGSTSFNFFGSTHDFNNGKTELSESDLLSALDAFLGDAIAGKDSFENFCSEFGYDTDSRTSEKTWKACKKSTVKAEKLGIDLWDLSNHIRETYNL